MVAEQRTGAGDGAVQSTSQERVLGGVGLWEPLASVERQATKVSAEAWTTEKFTVDQTDHHPTSAPVDPRVTQAEVPEATSLGSRSSATILVVAGPVVLSAKSLSSRLSIETVVGDEVRGGTVVGEVRFPHRPG